MREIEFTNEEIGQIYYAAGHLSSAEEYPEDRHAADSRELGLDVLCKIIAAREQDAVQRHVEQKETPSIYIENPEDVLPLFEEKVAAAWDEGYQTGFYGTVMPSRVSNPYRS